MRQQHLRYEDIPVMVGFRALDLGYFSFTVNKTYAPCLLLFRIDIKWSHYSHQAYIQDGPKTAHFQFTLSMQPLQPFKLKLNAFQQNVSRVHENKLLIQFLCSC